MTGLENPNDQPPPLYSRVTPKGPTTSNIVRGCRGACVPVHHNRPKRFFFICLDAILALSASSAKSIISCNLCNILPIFKLHMHPTTCTLVSFHEGKPLHYAQYEMDKDGCEKLSYVCYEWRWGSLFHACARMPSSWMFGTVLQVWQHHQLGR